MATFLSLFLSSEFRHEQLQLERWTTTISLTRLAYYSQPEYTSLALTNSLILSLFIFLYLNSMHTKESQTFHEQQQEEEEQKKKEKKLKKKEKGGEEGGKKLSHD